MLYFLFKVAIAEMASAFLGNAQYFESNMLLKVFNSNLLTNRQHA